MQIKLLGITNVHFDVVGQRLIISSIFVTYWRKSGSIIIHPLFTDFKKAYDYLGGKYYTIFSVILERVEN
jgi:hypothetical protein